MLLTHCPSHSLPEMMPYDVGMVRWSYGEVTINCTHTFLSGLWKDEQPDAHGRMNNLMPTEGWTTWCPRKDEQPDAHGRMNNLMPTEGWTTWCPRKDEQLDAHRRMNNLMPMEGWTTWCSRKDEQPDAHGRMNNLMPTEGWTTCCPRKDEQPDAHGRMNNLMPTEGWTTWCPQKDEQPDANKWWRTNSQVEMFMRNWGVLLRVLEAASLEEWKHITLSVRSSGSSFLWNYQRTNGWPWRNW